MRVGCGLPAGLSARSPRCSLSSCRLTVLCPPSGFLGPSPPLLADHPWPRLHTLGLGAGRLDLLDSRFCARDMGTVRPHRLLRGDAVQEDAGNCKGRCQVTPEGAHRLCTMHWAHRTPMGCGCQATGHRESWWGWPWQGGHRRVPEGAGDKEDDKTELPKEVNGRIRGSQRPLGQLGSPGDVA